MSKYYRKFIYCECNEGLPGVNYRQQKSGQQYRLPHSKYIHQRWCRRSTGQDSTQERDRKTTMKTWSLHM